MMRRHLIVALALGPLLLACESRVGSYASLVTGTSASSRGLSGLALSDGTLTPAFSNATTSYTANVTNAVSSITITPRAADASATVSVNGTVVASGAASPPIPLAVGSNVITVSATTPDGGTRSYVVNVIRAA